MTGPRKRSRPSETGLTRREALLTGFALLGGGLAAEKALHRDAAPARAAPDDPERLLALPDRDLLCLADAVLDRPPPPTGNPAWRRLLLRILAASIEYPSGENDLIAARAILLLHQAGGVTPAVETLVRGTPSALIARAALEKARRGRKEGP